MRPNLAGRLVPEMHHPVMASRLQTLHTAYQHLSRRHFQAQNSVLTTIFIFLG